MPKRSPFNSDMGIKRIKAAFGASLHSLEIVDKWDYGKPCIVVKFAYTTRHRYSLGYFHAQGCVFKATGTGGSFGANYHKYTEQTDLAPESKKATFFQLHPFSTHPSLPTFLNALYCLNLDLAPLEQKIGFSLSMHEKLEIIKAYNERLAEL